MTRDEAIRHAGLKVVEEAERKQCDIIHKTIYKDHPIEWVSETRFMSRNYSKKTLKVYWRSSGWSSIDPMTVYKYEID